MGSGFDLAAVDYDASFTHSNIGKLQRNRVYHYVLKYILGKRKHHTLEVNCGTGEDAIWLAQYSTNVLATDLSEKMLFEATSKSKNQKNITTRALDLNDFKAFEYGEKFDFIFSNFGGLNCISPDAFKQFLHEAADRMTPKAQMALVIMPKRCLWEWFYLLLKGQLKNMNRRARKEPLEVNVEGNTVTTWYYSPKEIIEFAKPLYRIQTIKPIGFFVPPSYLNGFFGNKKPLLNFLGWLDRRLDRFDFLSPYADHFIIILERI